jgi:pyrimidine operon attenuation protein/uracil phosphoribosyltransferase
MAADADQRAVVLLDDVLEHGRMPRDEVAVKLAELV